MKSSVKSFWRLMQFLLQNSKHSVILFQSSQHMKLLPDTLVPLTVSKLITTPPSHLRLTPPTHHLLIPPTHLLLIPPSHRNIDSWPTEHSLVINVLFQLSDLSSRFTQICAFDLFLFICRFRFRCIIYLRLANVIFTHVHNIFMVIK